MLPNVREFQVTLRQSRFLENCMEDGLVRERGSSCHDDPVKVLFFDLLLDIFCSTRGAQVKIFVCPSILELIDLLDNFWNIKNSSDVNSSSTDKRSNFRFFIGLFSIRHLFHLS